VQIDPSVNLEELARVAHSLGEVVGLGLRNLAHCPVELNLIPASTRKMQSFNEKKPYLVATVFSLVALVAAMGFLFQKLAEVKDDELKQKVNPLLVPAAQREGNFNKAYGELTAATNELNQVTTWLGYRYFWTDLLSEFRRVLIHTEQVSQQKLKTDVGVWIEQFVTTTPRVEGLEGMTPNPYPITPNPADPYARRLPTSIDAERSRYGQITQPVAPDAAAVPGASPATNEVSTITLKCRAVDLSLPPVSISDANTTIIYALQNELRAATNYFDAEKTEVIGTVVQDATTSTFTFDVLVALKHPLKP
jgi:hypothetical protein